MTNVVQLRTIAHGRNAGQLRPVTEVVLDGLTAMRDVAIKLKRNGFEVLSASADSGQPTIQVAWNRAITELLAAGEAGYWRNTHTERMGEFFGEANDGSRVRIVWVEKAGH